MIKYFKKLKNLPPFGRTPGRKGFLTVFPSDRVEIQDGAVYYHSFGERGEMRFEEGIDTSEWKAILDQKKCPFPIDFYATKPRPVYHFPFPIRILATPLSLTYDVITFPIQLFLFSKNK
jgi:hypothetical protein